MTRAAVSVAKMQRMKRAIEREGLPFRGFCCHPDGRVEALVGEPPPPAADLTLGPGGASSAADPLDAELEAWEQAQGH
jgi:hypothetical protein